jgi:hypothetical protein
MDLTGDDRDLPLIYRPEDAEEGGFDGGIGGQAPSFGGGEEPEGSEGDLEDELEGGEEGEEGAGTEAPKAIGGEVPAPGST